MSTLTQATVLAERNVLRLARHPAAIVSIVVTPTVFFLGFFMVMRKVLEAQGIDYDQFLPPAIVAQAMIFVGMSSAYFVADDVARAFSTRLRTLPLRPVAIVVARTGADLVRATLSLAVVLVLGTAVGFRFRAGPLPTVGFVALALAFAATLAITFGAAALTAKEPEATVQGLSMPYIFLFMLSTAFVPADAFPGWLQPFVRNQPVSQVIDALRALSTCGATAGPVLVSLLWIAGLVAVFGAVSLRALRRAR